MSDHLPQDELRRILTSEPEQLSEADLTALLRSRYTAEPVPPCRVCGGPLSIASAGGGSATIFACSDWEGNPDVPGELRRKVDRSIADGHYDRSRWTRYRDGDAFVLELLRRFCAN